MANDLAAELDRQIARLEARLDQLRTIRSLIGADPSLAADLVEMVRNPVEVGTSVLSLIEPDEVAGSEAPHLDRAIATFKAVGNRWLSVREITDRSGLSRNSVTALLYTSKYKHLFEFRVEGPKRKLWRMREGAAPDGSEFHSDPQGRRYRVPPDHKGARPKWPPADWYVNEPETKDEE